MRWRKTKKEQTVKLMYSAWGIESYARQSENKTRPSSQHPNSRFLLFPPPRPYRPFSPLPNKKSYRDPTSALHDLLITTHQE